MSPINYADYHPDWKNISRKIIYDRAGNRCELCPAENKKAHWKTGSQVVLTVHHIDGDIINNHPKNLIALCQRCHLRLDAPYRVKKKYTAPL
jgi:5-methylcytosine-specific restriction endonuclease McrA